MLEILIYGAVSSAIYALLAVGFTLIFGVARSLNLAGITRSFGADAYRASGVAQRRFWIHTHAGLLAAVLTGFGWPALLLWYLPSRLHTFWLVFIFAWFPHHPADAVGRYVDTRVAVFPGSRWIVRGHDHHALHHLFPRVPHYHLPALWADVATDMVAKGVRSEGRALASTGPVAW